MITNVCLTQSALVTTMGARMRLGLLSNLLIAKNGKKFLLDFNPFSPIENLVSRQCTVNYHNNL